LARNSAAAESEGGQKFIPPNPLSFCPPERSVWRAPARRSLGAGGKRAVSSVQKKVRISSNKRITKVYLYEFAKNKKTLILSVFFKDGVFAKLANL